MGLQSNGHGPRENVMEVLNVSRTTDGELPPPIAGEEVLVETKRVECGVPDLRSPGASVLVRLHGSQVS